MSGNKFEEKKIVDSRIISAQPIFGRWAVFTGLCGHCADEHVFPIGGLVAALIELKFEDGSTYTTVETMVPDSYGHYSVPPEEPEEAGDALFIAYMDSQIHPEEEELVEFVTEIRMQQKATGKPAGASKAEPEGHNDSSSKILTLKPGRNIGKDPKKPKKH